MSSTEPLIIGDGDPRDQLRSFVEAMRAGRAVSMVNVKWSRGVGRTAAQDLARAIDPGWLTPDTILLFTPGNNGNPRAMLRTSRSWRDLAGPFREAAGIQETDHYWVPGPLSTPANLFAAWQAQDHGLEVTLGYRAHPSRLGHVTVAHVLATMLTTVLDARERGLLRSLRTVVVRGTMPEDIWRRAERLGLALVEIYSVSELGIVAVRTDGAAYQPLPAVAVRFDDDGVLWTSSPYTAIGYVSQSGPFRHDGDWATVGDTGRWEPPHGEALSRFLLNEVTRPSPHPGGPAGGRFTSAEEAVSGLSASGEVVVLGSEEDMTGRGVSVLILAGAPDTFVVAQAIANLEPGQRPTAYAQVDEFPRTPDGVVDRQLLRLMLVDGTLPTFPLPVDAPPPTHDGTHN